MKKQQNISTKKQQNHKSPKQRLSLQQKTANFCKTVQAGDMVLFDVIDSSMAVFGYTRVGKTTSCHLLCRSPLRAEDKAGELIYVPSTGRFNTAIVGTGHESETQIPNIFQAMVREGNDIKNITILDQPGYGDTYGFHRIFSNGYFHYRTFSKTKKLKFVLAIWMNDLRGTAEKFRFTIRNFIDTFTNWDEVKKDVLKASSILITRADPQTNQNTLLDIIKTLRDVVGTFSQIQVRRYQQFVDHMLNQKKIFFVTRPTRANQITQDNTTLQKIYNKTTFWQRDLIGKNIVDMSQIEFSVKKQILNRLRDPNYPTFRQQFENYMTFTQQRLDGMIFRNRGSLRDIVQLLQQDARISNDSHQFLDAMQEFNNNYYNFLENFSRKREAIIANLFKNAQNEVMNQSVESSFTKQVKNIYFIKKFKVLEYLVEFNRGLMEQGMMNVRSIEKLEDYSNNFLLIFKKFSILAISKNDKQNIIYKYSYTVQRLIEESKILTLILFSRESDRGEFQDLNLTTSEDIFRMLYDRFFTPVLGEIDLHSLKVDFIQNMDFSTLVSANDEILNFFQSMPLKSQEIEYKTAQLIVEFQNNLFKNDANPQNERKKYILQKLYVYRNKFYSFWQNLQSSGKMDKIQKCSETIINLTKSLANVLQNMNLYSQARQTYRTINDAGSIFRIYELQAKHINKDRQLYRQLLIKYAADASIYYRKEKALECYQKAFSLSANIAEAKEISGLIVSSCTERKEDIQDDPYLSRLFNFDQKFFEDLPQNVKLFIEDECEIYD